MNDRMNKVNTMLKKAVSDIILFELNQPELLPYFYTVTHVKCSPDLHVAEVPDQARRDRLHRVHGALAGQELARGPANRLIEEVQDHDQVVEQNVPLHGFIQSSCHAGRGHGLGSGFRPHPAYAAGVQALLHQLLCTLRRAGKPKNLKQISRSSVPEAHVKSTECYAHNSVVAGVE